MSEIKNEATAKKPFFKSTSFKCIAVLLVIVLISGIFLTFCNALFTVTDEERLLRALGKLYDGETLTAEDYSVETVDESISVDDASINNVYAITAASHTGDYIVNVTGEGGYSSGTVTCYVVINITDSELSVGKVSISSNVNQSFISKISSKALDSFEAVYGVETSSTGEYYVLYSETSGFYTDPANSVTNHLATGATKSMGAICNAINAAVTYMKAVYLGEVKADPFEGFSYLTYIDKNNSTYGYSESNDGSVVYTIVTKSPDVAPNPYNITVVVGTDGTITSYTINSYGSYPNSDNDYPSLEYGSGFETYLVGKGQSDIEAIIGSGDSLSFSSSTISSYSDGSTVFTGATQSNFLCLYAALFATANYGSCVDALNNAEVNG